jgi:hypothetical protein
MTFLVKIINKLGNKINKLVQDNIITLLDEHLSKQHLAAC